MAQYRKRNDSDTWHWCANCQNYPRSGYTTSSGRPRSGEKCNECKAKDRRGDCR